MARTTLRSRKPQHEKFIHVIGTGVDKKTFEKVRQLAQALSLTTSGVLRMLIANALKEIEDAKPIVRDADQ